MTASVPTCLVDLEVHDTSNPSFCYKHENWQLTLAGHGDSAVLHHSNLGYNSSSNGEEEKRTHY